MSMLLYEHAGPLSSGEMRTDLPERAGDIENKHRAVAEFLESHEYDALLLQRPGNFSWFTSGGENTRMGSSETTAALFLTREARVIVTTNVDSAQMFDREVSGLGFQLKERMWHEPRHLLVEDICRGRTVASDTGFGRTADVSAQLLGMRLPLAPVECERYRQLGRLTAHAVEATARNFMQGETEAAVAGEVAHRLIKQQIIPERIQVWADSQGSRYRHWSYGSDPIQRFCTIAAVGRRWGLCAGVARTVAFGEPPKEVREAHHRTMLVQATGMYFSQPEWELFEIWNRVRRIYEKYGCSDEWQLADQAQIIGFHLCEVPVVPKSEFRASAGMAVHWHPSVGPAVGGDTILISDDGFEMLTPMEAWPKLTIKVKGRPLLLPDILQRTPSDDNDDNDDRDPGDSVLAMSDELGNSVLE